MSNTVQVGILDFAFDPVHKNVISVSGTVTFGLDVGNYLIWKVVNQHSDWIDAICETVDGGDRYELFQTRRVNVGSSITSQGPLAPLAAGRRLRIYRWAPGFLGIPGSGGGEAQFTMPNNGFVQIEVTVSDGR